MRNCIFALIAGLLFGLGLTISTMVDPARVLAFLDIFGDWDPTLAFVMGGGLAVYLPLFYLFIKPNKTTLFGEPCSLPQTKTIDAKLIVGAALFGIGWGLSGICPGPALANITGGLPAILLFVATMLLGMIMAPRVSTLK